VKPVREIIQFVPRVWSPTDGVADYARALAEALHDQTGLATWFLRGDPLDRAADGRDARHERSEQLAARSPERVVAALEARHGSSRNDPPASVLLHYANYGYASRGCPFWLIDGLAHWKARNPRARLTVMFHELYASGPPWRSAFWLSPIQRHLAGRLIRLCDHAVTSTGLYVDALSALGPRRPEPVLLHPVFSTVGEPERPVPWHMRQPWLVVLGRSGTERRAYGRHRPALTATAQALAVEKIVDIGPRAHALPADLAGIEVQAMGQLPREEVSRLLAESRAGFLDYPSDVLGKSTVFAAYCAHGVVPIIAQRRGPGRDGLHEDVHFLLAGAGGGASPMQDVLASISAAAAGWYRGHALGVQAAAWSRLLA
jgi:hypothetical protein